MSDLVTVIRFIQRAGIYSVNDTAGFPDPTAQEYISRGFAVQVSRNVPQVDPAVRAHDARRRAAELRAMATTLEGEAEVHLVEAGRRK